MEWPSSNVPFGGILHPKKVNYSEDTAKFLKELIDESKLSIRQKERFENILRNGEDLPTKQKKNTKDLASNTEVTIRPGSPRKRTIQTILHSGAYEREKFVPQHPVVDREKEKEKLQDIMAFNQVVEPKKFWPVFDVPNDETPRDAKINRFDQLEKEISDRKLWLEEMEKLGEADRFRFIINQQIQGKIREMEKLKTAKKL
ncbi:unnamed protein product [Brassicogethes aeneus]|uniref:Uncharacterized protein n=1 Tax=Brassicogethes aeneus TaxID=1431903 RepID=A0A9P0FMI7_BRAAE|nr:unnamed protein product [Brassicogethes aeneus]